MESNTLVSFDNLAAVLNEYGAAVRDAYREEMDVRGKNASGNLSRKVRFEVQGGADLFGGAAFEVLLMLPPYWFNVEFGRKPCPPSKHWVPVDKLIEWIKVKPVIPRPDKNGKIPTVKQLAYLINRAINDPDRRGDDPKRPGIAPTPVLQSALDKVNAEFEPRLEAAITADLNVYLNALSFSDFSRRGLARSNIVAGPHKR